MIFQSVHIKYDVKYLIKIDSKFCLIHIEESGKGIVISVVIFAAVDTSKEVGRGGGGGGGGLRAVTVAKDNVI